MTTCVPFEHLPKGCVSCPNTEPGENGVRIITPQFGESTTCCTNPGFRTGVRGGLMNYKKSRTSASSFTILKKSLTTVTEQNLPDTIGTHALSGSIGAKTGGPTNTGGPGDTIKSVPIITTKRSGNKARLTVLPHQIGVDVKHNSYERYLARKRGWVMRCQNC